MKYTDARAQIKTGDAALVRGNALISKMIRFCTGQQETHCGVFVWQGDGLFVAEEAERGTGILGAGYHLVPSSAWIQQQTGQVLWGTAPPEVSMNPHAIETMVDVYRHNPEYQDYGYIGLFKTLLSKWLNKPIPMVYKVCSGMVQQFWKFAGWDGIKHDATPGDIGAACSKLIPLEA